MTADEWQKSLKAHISRALRDFYIFGDCIKFVILSKSISRFARNTVDMLETVRHLKRFGIEVRFEKENIRTFDPKGDVAPTNLIQ